jgi:hypothetical protein
MITQLEKQMNRPLKRYVVWCTVPHWIEVDAYSKKDAIAQAEESNGGWTECPDSAESFRGTRVGVLVEEIDIETE